MEGKAVLSVRGLTVGYGTPLVSGIDLTVKPGEIIGIIGASGIGKTTLLRTFAGLVPPMGGQLDANFAHRGEVGYIPQRLGLVRHASVEHNVGLGTRATPRTPPNGWRKAYQWRAKITREAIEAMGLTDKTREPVRRLSGGQQRRTATARTLAQRPSLILADEFLSELDVENVEMVFTAILRLVEEDRTALVLVEHDVERALRYCTRVFKVQDGTLTPVSGGEEE